MKARFQRHDGSFGTIEASEDRVSAFLANIERENQAHASGLTINEPLLTTGMKLSDEQVDEEGPLIAPTMNFDSHGDSVLYETSPNTHATKRLSRHAATGAQEPLISPVMEF